THSNIDEVHVEHDEIDTTTELSDLEQGNESKTEASTVHRKRKNSKKQEEAETMPELFLEFLDEKKSKRIERSAKPEQADYLEQFFLYMSKTVKTFPPLYQAQVKSKVFEIVNSTEILLSGNNNNTLNSTSSTRFTYPQHTSQYTSSQLQPIFYDIPSTQTSTSFSTNMRARHSTAELVNSSSSGTIDGTISYSC
ncbi:hypothetical protein PV325_014019, partial [Microctonus aethiopoides]